MARVNEVTIQKQNSLMNFFLPIARVDKDVYTKINKIYTLRLIDFNELNKNFEYYKFSTLEYERSLYFNPESCLINDSNVSIYTRGRIKTKDVDTDTIKKVIVNGDKQEDIEKQTKIKGLKVECKINVDKFQRVAYYNTHLEEIRSEKRMLRKLEPEPEPRDLMILNQIQRGLYRIKDLPTVIENLDINESLEDTRVNIDKFTYIGFKGIMQDEKRFYIIDYAGRIYETDFDSIEYLVEKVSITGLKGSSETINSETSAYNAYEPQTRFILDYDPDLNIERPD